MPDVVSPELAVAPTSGDGAAATTCLQCGTTLVGAYCHDCGQHESVAERLTFRSLWRDFRVRRLHLDRGLPRTFVDVLLRPGHVARAFVEGRRQTYTHPITLLFVAYAIYALIYGFIEEPYLAMMEAQMEAQLAAQPMPSQAAGVEADLVMGMIETGMRIAYTYGAYFTLFIILPFAALLRWLLADRGRTMAECAVFGAYVEVAVVIPSMLVITPLSVWLGSTTIGAAGMVLYLVYAAFGARQFFDRRPGTMGLAILSVVVALVIYLAVFMTAAFGVGLYLGIQDAHAAGAL